MKANKTIAILSAISLSFVSASNAVELSMALAEDNNEAEVSLIDEVSEEFAIAAETPSQNVIISTGYENYGLGDVSVSDSDFYNVFDDIHDYSYDNSYSGTTVLNSIDLSTTSYFPQLVIKVGTVLVYPGLRPTISLLMRQIS